MRNATNPSRQQGRNAFCRMNERLESRTGRARLDKCREGMVVANAKACEDDSVLRVASVSFLFQCAALDSFYEIGAAVAHSNLSLLHLLSHDGFTACQIRHLDLDLSGIKGKGVPEADPQGFCDVLKSVRVHHNSHLCKHARYGTHAG